MPGPHGVGFAGFTEPFPAVLPQRLELAEPGLALAARGGDEGLVDQPAEHVEDLAGRHRARRRRRPLLELAVHGASLEEAFFELTRDETDYHAGQLAGTSQGA